MRIEQGLKQTLKASLNLQQTINMLQLGALDIDQFIRQEIESNPFLVEDTREEELKEEPKSEQEDFEYETLNDYAWDASSGEDGLSFNNIKSYYYPEDSDPVSNLEKETSLKDFILEQVYAEFPDNKERIIAYYLTDMLSESGYIEGNLEEIASQLKCSNKLINKVLIRLQKLEPAGIFARDLAECLKLQLEEKGLLNAQYEIILDNLPSVATKDFSYLARLCKLSESETRSMVSVIKGLNPKPGTSFSSYKVVVKIPDVFIRVDANGKIFVELNKDNAPKIKVSKEYYNEIKPKVKDQEQRKFLSEKYHSAGMLLSSLEQRNNAILKVAESIARLQRSFFEKGVLHVRPLTLQAVARDISMSESTVSRVTTNKYLACSYGVFEMKYFFSGGIQANSSSETVSSTKVKEIIKKLVELEDKEKVISDDELAKELAKFNIKIARRTVTKYREQLRIPTAFVRRREKADA
ncbi:MAG: polymerase sigma-54 factor [Rickettsiaceae bacterium]|jgi:RNA polymerase sigma-54 factor|nr:polymerase sigma-54 factor [Rickettsiaceae bacterium]